MPLFSRIDPSIHFITSNKYMPAGGLLNSRFQQVYLTLFKLDKTQYKIVVQADKLTRDLIFFSEFLTCICDFY